MISKFFLLLWKKCKKMVIRQNNVCFNLVYRGKQGLWYLNSFTPMSI